MTNEERDLITGLFNRLRSADNPQKDQEAENLIRQSVSAQPSAPYLLVQTVLVQEHALNNAQGRIQQLEKELQAARDSGGSQPPHKEGGVGGFLSNLFGGQGSDSQNQSPANRSPQQPPPMPSQQSQGYAPSGGQPQVPYANTMNMPPSAGGSFLKSALGTAAGVAGGAMLFQGIQSLFSHNAGPFGGGGFGGSGFLGGGSSHGGPDIIENKEVVNNYFTQDDDKRDDSSGGGSGSFLGEDTVGFKPHENAGQSTSDNDRASSFLGEDTVGFKPHEDNRQDLYQDSGNNYDIGGTVDTDDNLLAGTPDDTDTGSLDNSYDNDNSDAGGDFGGSDDDSSYV